MTDDEDDENVGGSGDPKNDGEGKVKGKGKGKTVSDQKPDEQSGDAGNIAELTKKLASMEELVEKQQAVIEKFKDVGKESPPPKTEVERIQELEATLELFKKKLESDQQAKDQAERQKREAAVDSLIKEMPEFKDQRDTLMKVDESVLTLFAKRQANTTPNPISRTGAVPVNREAWQKKLALAAERRKKHNEVLDSIRY